MNGRVTTRGVFKAYTLFFGIEWTRFYCKLHCCRKFDEFLLIQFHNFSLTIFLCVGFEENLYSKVDPCSFVLEFSHEDRELLKRDFYK